MTTGATTYRRLSAESLAQPENTALATQVQLVFRGTTLRLPGATTLAMLDEEKRRQGKL